MRLAGHRVLLLGAEHVQGLVAARSLGREGAVVHLGSMAPTANRWSRYVSATHRYPDPLRRPAAFRARVDEVCTRCDIDVVLPIDDASTVALRLGPPDGDLASLPAIAAPRSEDVALSLDKVALADACRAAGVAAPIGHVVDSPEAAGALAESLGPVVVKSRFAVRIDGDRAIEGGRVQRCWSPGEATAAARELIALEECALVQPVVPGVEFGVGAMRTRDGGLTTLIQRRVRSWPPTGGSPSLVRSVGAAPAVHDAVSRLLAHLRWEGVAQADVMLDGDQAVVLDLNARLWFSVGLGPRCGVDFPVMAAAAALGRPMPAGGSAPAGTGWAYADSELRYAFCLAANRRGVREPDETAVAALRRWRKEMAPPIQMDPFDRNDPFPAAGRLMIELPGTVLKHWWQRRTGTVAGS